MNADQKNPLTKAWKHGEEPKAANNRNTADERLCDMSFKD